MLYYFLFQKYGTNNYLIALISAFILVSSINHIHVFIEARPIHLTPENYYDVTKGKTLMVRFYVVELSAQHDGDSCPSCKVIERHWLNLAEKWSNHPFALLADVKCDWDGTNYVNNDLCKEFKVNKLLQFKFGDPLALEPIRWYDWELVTYDTLVEFANEHLSQPVCTLLEDSLPFCKRKELLQLRKALSSTEEELEHAIELEERKMSRIEDVDTETENIKSAAEIIQENYINLKKEKEEYWQRYIAIIENILQHQLSKNDDEDDDEEEEEDKEDNEEEEEEEDKEDDDDDHKDNKNDDQKNYDHDDDDNRCKTELYEENLQCSSNIYNANSNGGHPCDSKEMVDFMEGLNEARGNVKVLNAMLDEIKSKVHIETSKIDAEINTLLNTAEKLKRDLVEEAEFLYHSARENGYYFMKSAYKKKKMQRKS